MTMLIKHDCINWVYHPIDVSAHLVTNLCYEKFVLSIHSCLITNVITIWDNVTLYYSQTIYIHCRMQYYIH